jgi:hypothetical protein
MGQYLAIGTAVASLQIDDESVDIVAAIVASRDVDGSLKTVSYASTFGGVRKIVTFGNSHCCPFIMGVPYPQLLTTLIEWSAATRAARAPRARKNEVKPTMVTGGMGGGY